MSNTPTSIRLSPGDKQNEKPLDCDEFGRSGFMQVLHIDLWYVDGTQGEINVTSPHIIWGEDVETQWYHMRDYIKSQHERLGIVRYRAHCYHNINGVLKKAFSYAPFDLVTDSIIDEYK